MKILKNKIIPEAFIFLIILGVIFSVSPTLRAQPLNLKEVLTIGLKNNRELAKIREQLKSLTRDLRMNEAQRGWQLELGADINHSLITGEKKSPLEAAIDENIKTAALNINRTFASGLQFCPKIKIREEDLSPDLTLELSQPLYPLTPSSLKKDYYILQKELLKAEKNQKQLRSEKLISWLESYLNLAGLNKSREAYRDSLQQARANLEEVKKQKALGEVGTEKLLTAQLSVKEAEFKLEEVSYQLQEQKSAWKNDLGLTDSEIEIKVSPFLKELKYEVERLYAKYRDHQNLMTLIKSNSYQLKVKEIDRKILQKELEWLKKEERGNIDLQGNYNSDTEELVVGINLSYSLYDGGQPEIKLEAQKAAIKSHKRDYEKLVQELKNKLQQYENGVKLQLLNREQEELKLKRSSHRFKIARQQYKRGLIDYLEYQNKEIEKKQAHINYQLVQDQLFLARLKLVNFIDQEVWLESSF